MLEEKRDPNVQLAGIKVSAARGIVSCKTMRMRARKIEDYFSEKSAAVVFEN
jgi:hypothetical protein